MRDLDGRQATIKGSGSDKVWRILAIDEKGVVYLRFGNHVHTIHKDRIDLVPLPAADELKGMVTMDGFRTTRDEVTARGEREDGPVVQAAIAYIDRADEIHEAMRAEFGD